jgi:hypothetical protein
VLEVLMLAVRVRRKGSLTVVEKAFDRCSLLREHITSIRFV